LKELQENYFHT